MAWQGIDSPRASLEPIAIAGFNRKLLSSSFGTIRSHQQYRSVDVEFASPMRNSSRFPPDASRTLSDASSYALRCAANRDQPTI